MKLLIIDNYSSFTYNLVHAVEALGSVCTVLRNDKIKLGEVALYDSIIISPGPGIPEEAGITKEVIRHFSCTKKILGVCLGHQAIGETFGATLLNLQQVYHGVATTIEVQVSDPLFSDVPSTFSVGRYHSWVVNRENFPASLEVLAQDKNGQVMALRHRHFNVRGVQFHPESILTEHGNKIIKNWLEI